jgi:hypothetical protein
MGDFTVNLMTSITTDNGDDIGNGTETMLSGDQDMSVFDIDRPYRSIIDDEIEM